MAVRSIKRNKNKGNLTIFIFPYLFIDKEIEIGGFKLKPSYTDIFKKEPKRIQGHLIKLAKSFKLKDTSFINQYTYGYVTLHNKSEWKNLREFLVNFSTLIRYQELSEGQGASYSNFDYVVFEIYKPMSKSEFDYYQGYLNGKSTLSIHYPQTKFCPNFEIRPYIARTEGESKIFLHLFHLWQAYHSKEEKERILRAMDWYNKSYKNDPEIDDAERFISIAISFEALFNSPFESIQSNLSVNIITLLGETSEMLHWVKKFYDQRSEIVHGKEVPPMLYKGKGLSEYHLDNLLFARKVFTRCIKAIFTAREKVYTKDLHDELISNERRINEILNTLKSNKASKKLFDDGTFNKISALSQRDVTGKLEKTLEISNKLMPMAKKILQKRKRKDLIKMLNDILKDKQKDLAGLAVKFSEFHNSFSPIYFDDTTLYVKDVSDLALRGAIYNFSSYISWKLFREAFNRKGQK